MAPEGSATSPREERKKLPSKVERALPARGGMCNASESRGSASGEVVPVPLCVVGGHENKVGPSLAALPYLFSETCFNTVVYVCTSN